MPRKLVARRCRECGAQAFIRSTNRDSSGSMASVNWTYNQDEAFDYTEFPAMAESRATRFNAKIVYRD